MNDEIRKYLNEELDKMKGVKAFYLGYIAKKGVYKSAQILRAFEQMTDRVSVKYEVVCPDCYRIVTTFDKNDPDIIEGVVFDCLYCELYFTALCDSPDIQPRIFINKVS